mmetsp:Transcript_28654/g.46577  ORF Transcript_28654/g.46577 Transcript_28654/m.46577 type:complete len:245 (-) Transcript_28654:491-1225(-)
MGALAMVKRTTSFAFRRPSSWNAILRCQACLAMRVTESAQGLALPFAQLRDRVNLVPERQNFGVSVGQHVLLARTGVFQPTHSRIHFLQLGALIRAVIQQLRSCFCVLLGVLLALLQLLLQKATPLCPFIQLVLQHGHCVVMLVFPADHYQLKVLDPCLSVSSLLRESSLGVSEASGYTREFHLRAPTAVFRLAERVTQLLDFSPFALTVCSFCLQGVLQGRYLCDQLLDLGLQALTSPPGEVF